MVAKEPADRFATMDEVIESLELVKKVLIGDKADVLTATLRVKPKYRPSAQANKRKQTRVIAAGVLVGLALLGAGLYFTFVNKEPEPSSSQAAEADSEAPLVAQSQVPIRSLDWDWPAEYPPPARYPFDAATAKTIQQQWQTSCNYPSP